MDKTLEWDKEKNQKLMRERGVSFDAVVSNIESGNVLAIVPGKGKFKHQKQYIVNMNGYVYIVPAVEEKHRIFLKTIIPSRKLTKQYLRRKR